MGSTLRRLRIYYINNIRVSRVLIVTGLLVTIYLIGRFLTPNENSLGIVRYREEETDQRGLLSDDEVSDILNSLQDTRPVHCKNRGFDFTHLDASSETVSILTEFHGAQFYDLQLTLTSIVDNTPYDLYVEIIVVDDGTSDPVIRRQAAKYLQKPKFNKVRLYRSETREGQSVSRYKASRLSRGNLLVYVSATSIVNRGWLQPLIHHLTQDSQIIVTPHSDNVLPGRRFFQTNDALVPVFTYSLYTVYLESTDPPTADGLLRAPLMRGDCLAVHKSQLNHLGNFDDKFHPLKFSTDSATETGGGHHLELSLRAWLCGGGVQVATCSRVATHSALRPHRVSSDINYRRLVELWLSEYKSLVYRQGSASSVLSENEIEQLTARKQQIQQSNNCHDFKWYLDNVATGIKSPSSKAMKFGKIKSKGNYCLRGWGSGVKGRGDGEVDMTLCRQHIYDPAMMFELTRLGELMWWSTAGDRENIKCLVVDEGGRVKLEECRVPSTSKWRLVEDRIRYEGAVGFPQSSHKCLTQVTVRNVDTSEYTHHAQVKDCIIQNPSDDDDTVRPQIWEFIHY